MNTITCEEVYRQLKEVENICSLKGQIRFKLSTVDIIVKQRDVVGNIIQEWMAGWFKAKGFFYAVNENTQMPPDFYLSPDCKIENMLEVKAFNYETSPAFDIADFNSFQREIITGPQMLHVKYLIFGYIMTEDGYVIIKDLWLKSVWEICRRMEKWPLNLQVKDKVVHKIRPGIWFSKSAKKAGKFDNFRSLEDFISALVETVYQNPKTHNDAGGWLKDFLASYKKAYKIKLKIPKWEDIEDDYLR